jgi:hypothetical protein
LQNSWELYAKYSLWPKTCRSTTSFPTLPLISNKQNNSYKLSRNGVIFVANFVSIESGRSSVVFLSQRQRRVPIGLRLQELFGPPIATHFHLLEFHVFPLIHSYGPNEAINETIVEILRSYVRQLWCGSDE